MGWLPFSQNSTTENSAGETCPCQLPVLNHNQNMDTSTLRIVIRQPLWNCGSETHLRRTATSRNHHLVKALQGCQENLRNKMKPHNHKLQISCKHFLRKSLRSTI